MTRSLILLDVDGVLNPSRRPGPGWLVEQITVDGETYPVRLNPHHGAELLALADDTGAELVWATTWNQHANEEIGPRIGLPELRVLQMPNEGWTGFGANPKTQAVATQTGGCPFVWFDDALSRHDRIYLDDHVGRNTFRLIHIGQRRGLTAKHITQARTWLQGTEPTRNP
jgi:HAD domain in Swiss Army Knife RNA repair proteins